jgi:flagellar basal body-associated protein FliL
MLEGHSTGIRDYYARPTEQEMYQEYQKAVNLLTINEENRLKIKVESYERNKTTYEELNEKMNSIQNNFVEILDKITNNENLKNVSSEDFIKALKKSFQNKNKNDY